MSEVCSIIGARLNSSRLPRKHLLDLAGKPLISRIFQRLEAVPEIDTHILATTADTYNRPLADWARGAGKLVEAWDGDVNDLTGRVDHVVRRVNPKIVVYVCGDSPLVEPSTLSSLIQALQAQPDADIAYIKPSPNGAIHEGFDVYTTDLWRRIEAASTQPFHREHVGSARDLCKPQIVYIEDDPVFYQVEHRLSVDTPSDYRFMQRIYLDWYAANPADSLVSLPWVIARLQQEPGLRAMNANVHQKGLHQRSVPVDVIAAVPPNQSLDTSVLDLVHELQDRESAGVTIHLVGIPNAISKADQRLSLVPHHWYDSVEAALEAARGERLHVARSGLDLEADRTAQLSQQGVIWV